MHFQSIEIAEGEAPFYHIENVSHKRNYHRSSERRELL